MATRWSTMDTIYNTSTTYARASLFQTKIVCTWLVPFWILSKEQAKNKLSCTSTCLLYREQFSTSNLVLVQDVLYCSCTYLVFRLKNKLSCTRTCLLYREQFSTSNLVPVQDILYCSCTRLVFRLKNKLSCTSTCLLYREQFSTSILVLVQAVLYFQ